jgi:hypothetical protein
MDISPPSHRLNAAPAGGTTVVDLPAVPELRLAGTASLASIAPDDPRLVALRRACALLEELEAERAALRRRLEESRRLDPMQQVCGRSSLDRAAEDTRRLVHDLDRLLCDAAEGARTAAHTHPKDSR